MTSRAPRLARWKSEAGRKAYRSAYEDALGLWPVPYESELIHTRFGRTHAVVSGNPNSSPVILVPAAIGVGAIQWFPNVARLAATHRVYALDFVGAPGLGIQEQPILDRSDCARWLLDVMDEIGSDRVDLVGSSQGGWMALNAAIDASERVGRLVLLAPAASFRPFHPWALATLRIGPYLPAFTAAYTLKASFGGRYSPDDRFVDLTTVASKHFEYQDRAVFPGVFTDDELRELRLPTLVMVGDKDLVYNPSRVLDRARHLMADATTELVSNAGHVLNLEQPALIDRHILGHLES